MNHWLLFRRLRAPAFLILFGFLALLNQWDLFSFRRSWPLFLILAGVLLLAERAALAGAFGAGESGPGESGPAGARRGAFSPDAFPSGASPFGGDPSAAAPHAHEAEAPAAPGVGRASSPQAEDNPSQDWRA